MFIKSNRGKWINLSTCRQVDIVKRSEKYRIELRSGIVLPNSNLPTTFYVGNFDIEEEAQQNLNFILQAYNDGDKVWEVVPITKIDDRDSDDRSTLEYFEELISQSEYSDFYESRSQTERLCEFGVNLMDLVKRNQWDLFPQFKKYYIAFYYMNRRVFGINLFARPKLCVWLPHDLFEGNYECENHYDSHGCGVFSENVNTESIEELLEFAYFWAVER